MATHIHIHRGKVKDSDASRNIIGSKKLIQQAIDETTQIIHNSGSGKEIDAAEKAIRLLTQAKQIIQSLG